MKRTRVYTLTASLCLVAAAGCRGEPQENPPVDMAMATDLSAAGDDLSAPPPDLTEFDLTLPPPPTEFMVVRIGDGTNIANGSAAPVFLERRQVSDGAMVGAPLALPTAVSGLNKRLTLTHSNFAEGQLGRSTDGRYLVVAGYDAMVGTMDVVSSTAATVNRVIGRIDAAGNIDTSTAAAFFDAQGPRSVATTNGTDLWVSGQPGILYTTLGNTAAPTSIFGTNVRWLDFIAGQLFVSSGAGATRGINTVGSGAPKSTATATRLAGFDAQTSNSMYGFVAFDRVAPIGIDTIYVANDSLSNTVPGVHRWSLNGATWTYDGRMSMGLGTVNPGARGLAAFRTATSVTLIATTSETSPRVVKLVDDGSPIDQITATQLVPSALFTAYRGVALPAQ